MQHRCHQAVFRPLRTAWSEAWSAHSAIAEKVLAARVTSAGPSQHLRSVQVRTPPGPRATWPPGAPPQHISRPSPATRLLLDAPQREDLEHGPRLLQLLNVNLRQAVGAGRAPHLRLLSPGCCCCHRRLQPNAAVAAIRCEAARTRQDSCGGWRDAASARLTTRSCRLNAASKASPGTAQAV